MTAEARTAGGGRKHTACIYKYLCKAFLYALEIYLLSAGDYDTSYTLCNVLALENLSGDTHIAYSAVCT